MKTRNRGLVFAYPKDAEISERQDTNYFSVDATVNNGDNPALNVYGQGNYKVQIQVYKGKSLDAYLRNSGYDLKITTTNGISKAMRETTSQEIQGPGYNTFYLEKNQVILAISLIGDIAFDENVIIDTFKFL
jgi:hypothetical protein